MIDVGSAGFQNFSPLYFHAAAEQAARETGAREPVVPPAESSSSNNTGASGSERERARGDSSSQVQGSWYTPSDAEGGESSYAVNERGSDDSRRGSEGKDSGSGTGSDSGSGSEKRGGSGSTERALNGKELTEQEIKQVDKLKSREKEVITHELRHQSVGGQYASAPSYGKEKGPDGRSYITDGSVQISVSEESTPEKTISKMQQVYAAALAPAEPSSADRSVAAKAKSIEASARAELAEQKAEEASGSKSADKAEKSDKADKADNAEKSGKSGGSGTVSRSDAAGAEGVSASRLSDIDSRSGIPAGNSQNKNESDSESRTPGGFSKLDISPEMQHRRSVISGRYMGSSVMSGASRSVSIYL